MVEDCAICAAIGERDRPDTLHERNFEITVTRSSLLNLDHLTTFASVMAHGSFSAAARQLGLSQPAVSLQIRQLERRLGAVLVERTGREARPSAAGAALLSHVGAVRSAVEAALDAVAPHAAGMTGRVHIGTGATACTYLLPPLLRRLRRQFPDADISVATGNTSRIVQAVEADELDLGLVTLPAGGRSLDVTPVLDDEFLALAPASMRLPARIGAAALAGRPLVAYESDGHTRRIVDGWFARAGVEPQVAMSLGSIEAIKQMVRAGMGCAVVPGLSVQGERDRQGLQARSLSPRLHRRLGVVVRRDKRLHRALAAALQALKSLGGG
jgi:DNA-binding transcriptional LysR family regulator